MQENPTLELLSGHTDNIGKPPVVVLKARVDAAKITCKEGIAIMNTEGYGGSKPYKRMTRRQRKRTGAEIKVMKK